MSAKEIFILSARSIDGTIYKIDGGWTDDRAEAQRMSKRKAQSAIDRQRLINQTADADDIIGRLEIEVTR